jgi:Asp-tRNA(Asn)/Glu-tRNA(Gln) amidotransferase A subunit family amidase
VPGLTLPLGKTDEGFYFGFEIDGPENNDLRLLAIAAAIEKLDIGSE